MSLHLPAITVAEGPHAKMVAKMLQGRIHAQVVAYNKMDIPDSSDYWEDVRASLLRDHGVAPEDCMAISAVTGQGTTELVRRLHALLDTLPESVSSCPHAALVHTRTAVQVWRCLTLLWHPAGLMHAYIMVSPALCWSTESAGAGRDD